jgi:PleD family two-component response regulator
LTNNDDIQNRPNERPRILVVDDIPANIKTLNAILADDYNVIFATDWRKGLELAEQRSPDIILLDIMMPDMDGYEICQRLKADVATREIPVIFITALDGEADEEKGLAIGAADYITKPFRPAIVRLRVANHLQLKLHRDRLESLTMTDGLTEIANRRRFDQHLDQEWRRCATSRHSMTTTGIRPATIASGISPRRSRQYRFGPGISSLALAARNSPACCRGRMVRAQVPSLGACSTR